MPRTDFLRLALKIRCGEHVGADGVHYLQVPWVTIASAEPLSVNVDGEPSNATVLEYRARPQDLRIHVRRLPEDAPIA